MVVIFSIWSFLYAIFSFALTDPNLVLMQFDAYLQFQNWMWQVVFSNPILLTTIYVLLLTTGFGIYFSILRKLWSAEALREAYPPTLLEKIIERLRTRLFWEDIFSPKYRSLLLKYLLIILPLLFSYNALSHDVFNYMFNAKMVVKYGANPHQQTALDFSNDLWVRFMHNTHTPAPYGYGWTAVSVIPYVLGFGKFITTWLSFRVFSILSILALYVALQFFSLALRRKYMNLFELFIVFCNPLFLLEVVSNVHNDLWMLAPAIVSLGLAFQLVREKYVPERWLLISAALLAFSITIKFATILLLIPWLFLLILHALKLYSLGKLAAQFEYPFSVSVLNAGMNLITDKLYYLVPFLSSILLFIPLITARSQQFHPWYLLWSFVWLPFVKNKIWRIVLLSFSVTSMVRYIPWLWTGGFEDGVLTYQKAITWLPVLLVVVAYYAISYNKKPGWWK